MKDHRDDRFHNAISTPGMVLEGSTPDTPYIHNLELIEEPPQLLLPLSEIYEMMLQEASSAYKDVGGSLSSSSGHRFWDQYKKSFNFSLNSITKNLSKALTNAYDKREMLRLKKSKTSIYWFMGRKDKAKKRWNRMNFIKCR